MKMLAALDQSEFSWRVLEEAVRLAAGTGAGLTLLTVVDLPYDALWGAGLGGEMNDRLYEEATAFVDKARAMAAEQGVQAEALVELGMSPAAIIVDLAKRGGYDMIVMGHIGRSGLNRFLLGSVATKVVAHAPCSVHVVR